MTTKKQIEQCVNTLRWLKFSIVGTEKPKKNTFEYATKVYLENAIELLKDSMVYAEIEKEIGIDLITLFKALTNGIWIKGVADANSRNKIIFVRPTLYMLGKKLVVGFVIPYAKRTNKEGNYFGTVRYFDGYGKTWALTKEELL